MDDEKHELPPVAYDSNVISIAEQDLTSVCLKLEGCDAEASRFISEEFALSDCPLTDWWNDLEPTVLAQWSYSTLDDKKSDPYWGKLPKVIEESMRQLVKKTPEWAELLDLYLEYGIYILSYTLVERLGAEPLLVLNIIANEEREDETF